MPAADREFVRPHAVTLKLPLQEGETERRTLLYDFDAFNADFAWPFEKWGEEEAWGEAQIRIDDACKAAKDGCKVRLSLEDWEKYRTALKAAKIGGVNVNKLRRMQLTVLQAQKGGGSK